MLQHNGYETSQADRRPMFRQPRWLWVLSVAALAVHNVEEWLLDLTGWMAGHPWLPGSALHGDQARYALALIIVTAAVALLAAVAILRQPAWSPGILVCVGYALIINAAGHLAMSVLSWDLMPGTATGTLVLLPVGLLVTRSLPPIRWTVGSMIAMALAVLGTLVGSLLLAAALG